METNTWNDPQKGREAFCSTNRVRAIIFRRKDFHSDNLCWWILLISRFSDCQATPAPQDDLSDPNLTPLSTHQGIKYVAGSQEPLLRYRNLPDASALKTVNSNHKRFCCRYIVFWENMLSHSKYEATIFVNGTICCLPQVAKCVFVVLIENVFWGKKKVPAGM